MCSITQLQGQIMVVTSISDKPKHHIVGWCWLYSSVITHCYMHPLIYHIPLYPLCSLIRLFKSILYIVHSLYEGQFTVDFPMKHGSYAYISAYIYNPRYPYDISMISPWYSHYITTPLSHKIVLHLDIPYSPYSSGATWGLLLLDGCRPKQSRGGWDEPSEPVGATEFVFFHPGMITNIHGSVGARSITGLEGLARVFQAPMGILGGRGEAALHFKHMMVP